MKATCLICCQEYKITFWQWLTGKHYHDRDGRECDWEDVGLGWPKKTPLIHQNFDKISAVIKDHLKEEPFKDGPIGKPLGTRLPDQPVKQETTMPTPLTRSGLSATEAQRNLTPDEVIEERSEIHRLLNSHLESAMQSLSRAWNLAVHLDQRASVERAMRSTFEAKVVASRQMVNFHELLVFGMPSPQANKEDLAKVKQFVDSHPPCESLGGIGSGQMP